MLPESKYCPDCDEVKLAAEFYVNNRKTGRVSLSPYCKVCSRLRYRAYQKKMREKWREVTPPEDGERLCPSCNEVKPLGAFSINRSRYDGRAAYCKDCVSSAERAMRVAEGERIRARDRERYSRDRTRKLATNARWRQVHSTKVRAHQRAWFQANKNNPRVRRTRAVHQNQRNHRARIAEGRYSVADVERALEAQRGLCLYCGSSMAAPSIDHLIAVTRGGSHWPHNIGLACCPCNSAKSARSAEEYLAEITAPPAVLDRLTQLHCLPFWRL